MTEWLNWTEWLTLSLSSFLQPGKNYGSEIELRYSPFFMSEGPRNVLHLCSADGLAGGHCGYVCGAHGNFWVFTIPLGAAGKPRGLFLTFLGCSLQRLVPLQCRVLLCVWGFWNWSWTRVLFTLGFPSERFSILPSLFWGLATMPPPCCFPSWSSPFSFCWEVFVCLEWGRRENKENPSFQCVCTFCNVLLSCLGRSEECTCLWVRD